MGTTKRVKKYKNYMGRNFKKIRVAEKLTPDKRSSLMSKIRSKNTKFEEEFIALASLKFSNSFITHVRALKGTPDMVFEREKVCVFLDSDFWHGWQYPRWKHLLKDDFWREKISKNRQRDIRNTRLLKGNGWKVIRIWEHQIKLYPEKAIDRILNSLKSGVEQI
jgi:DNA mismatch endonuclease (patch repair protein)